MIGRKGSKWSIILLLGVGVIGSSSALATQPASFLQENEVFVSKAPIVEAIGSDSETAPIPTSSEEGHRQILMHYMRSYNARLTSPQLQYLADAILRFSAQYGVNYQVVASIIAVESSFRHDVVSTSGAIGLGQLKPSTAKWLGVNNPYHPGENIAGITRYISWLLRKYGGNTERALSAYYQGPGTVDRQGITPACMPYLAKINGAMSRFP